MILKPTKENIARAAEEILGGGVVAFHAGTVFGLGGLAPYAADRIRRLKGRGRDKPFLLNVASVAAIKRIARVSAAEYRLMRAFMPGELTLVLRAKKDSRLSGDGFVRVRVPGDPPLLALLRKIGAPLISTSANRSGDAPALSAAGVQKIFPRITVLDSPAKVSGVPSTIAKVENGKIEILRLGNITPDEMLKAL
ncbi:MAG: L-threonylcarbamoyladenylate synthase [Rickettsiales bacterium]|jgi:L-threonylcarbamoyladenylate synthase|nr:L-threonylcarbamoyladenylate synthase [Rickettsiales bacterium]